MANTPLDDLSADDRYVDTATCAVASSIGRKTTFAGDLLRHARPPWRKDLDGRRDDVAISFQRRKPGSAAEASRSPMDAGITRGSSLLFGGFGSKR